MKTKHTYYKIEVSYFGTNNNEKIEETNEINFKNESLIFARTEAIERFNSYLDIFEDGKRAGNIQNWGAILKTKYENYTIPTLNLYICYDNEKENDVVLFGSLLETFEERMEELEDELKYYEENDIEHNGIEVIESNNGGIYKILKNSLIHIEDESKIKTSR